MFTQQKELLMTKILEAAKNFKQEVYIRSQFKLNEECIYYFKHLGYKVLIEYDTTITPYIYTYEINWK